MPAANSCSPAPTIKILIRNERLIMLDSDSDDSGHHTDSDLWDSGSDFASDPLAGLPAYAPALHRREASGAKQRAKKSSGKAHVVEKDVFLRVPEVARSAAQYCHLAKGHLTRTQSHELGDRSKYRR